MQYLYGLTFGCFGVGWIVDTFIICCCLHWLKKKGSVALYFPYSMFTMKIHKKEDAYDFINRLGELVSANVHDERLANGKIYQHRKKYYNQCSDYICGAKQFTDFTTVINRDEVSLTEVFNNKTQPCIYPSLCFPICWMGNVCPFLCCCFRKCCAVVESKEDKSIIYLKNLNQFNTNQSSCNCCGSSKKNIVTFQVSGENVAHLHSREDVTEAEALLSNFASRPTINGGVTGRNDGGNFFPQNTMPVPKTVPVVVVRGTPSSLQSKNIARKRRETRNGKSKNIEMVSNPTPSSLQSKNIARKRRETRHYSQDHGKYYIHDHETNETRWEDANHNEKRVVEDENPKRRRSTRHYSEEHQKYYIHDPETNTTKWEI